MLARNTLEHIVRVLKTGGDGVNCEATRGTRPRLIASGHGTPIRVVEAELLEDFS